MQVNAIQATFSGVPKGRLQALRFKPQTSSFQLDVKHQTEVRTHAGMHSGVRSGLELFQFHLSICRDLFEALLEHGRNLFEGFPLRLWDLQVRDNREDQKQRSEQDENITPQQLLKKQNSE